jgi:hypothetical protein
MMAMVALVETTATQCTIRRAPTRRATKSAWPARSEQRLPTAFFRPEAAEEMQPTHASLKLDRVFHGGDSLL